MLALVLIALLLYLLIAYLFLPFFWKHYERQPEMKGAPTRTRTKEGIPGDPLNIGLVGDEDRLRRSLGTAGWLPADPLGVGSLWGMAKTLALKEPYPTAPISPLYLFDRKEDLAFEKAAGPTLKQRHHVRFWRADALAPPGTLFWIGATTYDVKIGLSHYTGQVLHHISADIDAERDLLIQDLNQAGCLTAHYSVSGLGPTLNGRNGEGDWFFTDGDVCIGVLAEAPEPARKPASPPSDFPLKQRLWTGLKGLLRLFHRHDSSLMFFLASEEGFYR